MVGMKSEASPEACRLVKEHHMPSTHSNPRQNEIHGKQRYKNHAMGKRKEWRGRKATVLKSMWNLG